jgi:TRAP-type C4-dicarboxylate transport system substrate-binding protein
VKRVKNTALVILAVMMVGFIFLTACSSSTSTVTSVSTSTATSTSTLTQTSVTTSVVKPVNLLLATTDAPGGIGGYPITAWVEEIEKRTDGRVKVEVSWSSALGAESEYLDLLKNGVCDMEFILPAIVASGVFPRSEILALPWTMDSAVAANKGMSALCKAGYFDKEYADQGLKVAAIFAAGGMADPMMFTTKNVTKLADVKGLKIQAPGSVKTAMCEGMGGVPTYANLQELYLALQKGILDGMFCP